MSNLMRTISRPREVISDRYRTLFAKTALIAATALLASPLGASAQATSAPANTGQSSSEKATTSASKDRWLHVRVISSDAKGETVRVNIPLELAEKVLPAIHQDRIHAGKDELDLVAALHALSAQGDTELVSVKDHENTVRVWLDSKNVTD